MEEDVLKDCRTLFELMRRFWTAFGHRMNTVLLRSGVNVPQYTAMVALGELGEATMSELSRKLRVTMGASTNIVDKLVRAGYVTRSRSKEDRRVVRVKLRRKGRETLKEMEARAVEFMAAALAGETAERRRQFIESYRWVVAAAEAGDKITVQGGENAD